MKGSERPRRTCPTARGWGPSHQCLWLRASGSQRRTELPSRPWSREQESRASFGQRSSSWRQTKQLLLVTFGLEPELAAPPASCRKQPLPADPFWVRECNEHLRSGCVLPEACLSHSLFPEGSDPARRPGARDRSARVAPGSSSGRLYLFVHIHGNGK